MGKLTLIFHLSYSFLRCATAFNFNQVPFVNFCFCFPLLWEVNHRGSCYDLCQRVFCLCSPLGVLQFLVLTFRSLIHFEFIFVYGVRKCSCFILLQLVDQFSQHHLLKRLSLIHCIFLPLLSKIRCP